MAIIHVHRPFLLLLLIFPITTSNPDSEALLRLKRSFTNATALDSWKPGTEPCDHNNQWTGVICHNGVVSGLRLGHLGLNGNIDVDALASISGLRSIAIMSNAFSGPIPNFNRLGNLRGLYITNNLFSGVIPSDYFSTMDGLRKIWLSGNNFWGPIPSSIVQLTHLIELHIESNHFSGTIPPLQQTSLNSLDLSNNNLEGEIPSSLSRFSENSFGGNKGLCGANLGKKCNQLSNSSVLHHTPENAFQISMWVLLAFFLVLLMMVVAIYVMRRTQERYNMMVEENLDPSLSFSSSGKKDEFGSGKGFGSARAGSSKRGVGDLVIINYENGEFGLADLMKAAAELLGNGALGSSYKATMANGLTVVVKRMKEMTKIGKEQFDAEMRRLGRLEHKNVLTPLAYHYRKDEKLLIYEYQPKGSLLIPLHGDRKTAHTELTWPIRLKIIQGIARGLGYLHTQLSSLDLPHGDLKSSNVLLTPNYEPLLTDYGYSSLISCSRAAQSLTGYKSPEAILDHNISPKCDVFCLGIIIVEILTGKFPSQYITNGKGGTDLVQWSKSAISEGKEVDLFDPDIASDGKSLGEMEQLLHIGVSCTESNPDKRLDVREAIRRIEGVHEYQGTKSSLSRDGYADQPFSAFEAPVYNDHSGRRRDGIEEPSGHKSVTFDMS